MSENSEQNLLANVRLCDAIKWHPCLYDSKSKVYQMKHAVDAAWQSIANECEDTVANCKLRWRIIRKSYLRSFRKNVPYNRYYLNDYLDFLKPHLPTLESNEDRASKAEDYDIIQLDEEQQEDDDDDDEEEDDDDDDDENDGEQDEDNEQDDEDDGNDEEVEEYELRNDNIEDPDEDSDTASAEETLKAIRRGRPKGKASNMSTPDIEEDNDNLSSQDKNVESGRIGRRLMRTRKANSRYSEYDIYVKRYKKEAKQEEKPKTNNKRSLEPNIVDKSETKQDEKRPRRSLDRSKNLPTLTREEFNKPKQPMPKKLEVKLMKPKVIEPPPAETKAPKPTPKEVFKVRTSCVKIDKNLAEMARIAKPKMVDNSTNSVATKTVDAGTQYDANEPNTVDDDFVESLKPQMALMNSRQKFSFKKRVFQSLMDVFDDSTNFPNKNELIELPNTGAPRFESTTTGELRLMRELVNLVTAAKSTPEIMNAREKVATPKNDTLDLTPSPIKAPFAQSEAPTSQTSSSSTSNAQGKRSETLGLPRHILQKVVKVAGSNGGTILAHEGDKRRVYRIYPKGTLPPSVANNTAVPASTSIGTFYVTPPKPQIANNSQTNTMVRTTTQVGNTVHGKPITFTTISKGGTQQTSNNLTASTPTSMMAQVTKKMALFNASTPAAMSRQRLAGRTQISQRRYSITNATSKNSPVQNKVVTSTNPPATSATQEKPSSSNAYPVQRFSVSSLEATSKSGLSQIQISQPISLNVAATPRESGIKAFLSSAEEGNSGDNEIFPDNPLPEAVAENVASNDDLLMVDANIKDEPMD